MSATLTSLDLHNLFALITTADIKVGQVPALWLSIQRLETASKSGMDYAAVSQPEPSDFDGNK